MFMVMQKNNFFSHPKTLILVKPSSRFAFELHILLPFLAVAVDTYGTKVSDLFCFLRQPDKGASANNLGFEGQDLQ